MAPEIGQPISTPALPASRISSGAAALALLASLAVGFFWSAAFLAVVLCGMAMFALSIPSRVRRRIFA